MQDNARIAAEIEDAYAEREAKRRMPFFRDDYRDQMEERALPSAELEKHLWEAAEQEYGEAAGWAATPPADVDGRAR